MKIRSLITLSGALILLLNIIGCQQIRPRPNIILVMTDDQGWFDAGFNGNELIKTPNLDKLASEGIVLDRFYSASAVCSPTRASVITGRNPLRMDIPYANAGHMKDQEITLPEILKDQGYNTGHFGKWHLGILTRLTLDANRGGSEQNLEHYSIPTMNGYDEYFCTESKVPTFDPMVYPASMEEGESKKYGWKAREENEPVEQYGTAYWTGIEEKETSNLNGDDSRVIMDRAIPFIETAVNEAHPFFATIWFHTPHLPVVSDREHRNHYSTMEMQQQIYYGAITAMDEQIGRLWTRLEELGIQDETMIWFCSDNGPENNTPGSAGIFRGRKRSLYEGGVRVPAFVVWKDQLEEGRRSDFPSVTSDYLPTILDILDVDYPDDRPIDGESLWGLLKGKKKEREEAIGFIYKDRISWVDNQYKLISLDSGETYELYDLVNDPVEKVNIIQNEPEIAARMKTELSAWKNSVENSKNEMDYPK
ncbi:MAG TPA: N-acetylgalactosamine 6-sulfate sulfatase [Bacteroides sp.]|nr:N-acetylgalactosamine 6-sulfate sulfatase [Bacteroides sp.]